MQTIGKRVERITLRGVWLALLSIVAVGMLAPRTFAQATEQKNVVLSGAVSYATAGKWPAGGALAGGVASGGSWGMNSKGTIVASTTYGGDVIQFTGGPSAYTVSVAGPYGGGNVGAVAVDANNNLWVGGIYSNKIVKVPMNTNGTYTVTDATATGATTPSCNGTTDTSECLISNLSSGYFGVESMAFDSAGDLFFATNNQTYSGDPYDTWSIYECKLGTGTGSSSCLYGTEAAVLIFQEPGPVTVNYTPSGGTETSAQAQLWVGDLAFDSENDLFFTDSAIISDQESAFSDVNEMVYDSSNHDYDISNQVLVTDSPVTASAPLPNGGDYDEQIVSIAVVDGASHQDTVYFGATDGGIFAAPDSAGTVNNFYGVANGNGDKLILPDGNGNFYVDAYNGGDTLGFIALGSVTDPTITGSGQSSAFTLNASDSDSAACSATTPSLTLAVSGSDASAFDATAPVAGTCGGQTIGSGTTFPVTVTFSPTAVGSDTATLTATDSATSGTGNITLNATALKKQIITFSPTTPVTYASGLTIALTASGGASTNPVTFTLVSGPATFDATVADQLDVSAPGTIVVTANQAGNSTYAPAPAVTKSIVVSPIPQTIDWAPVPPRNVTTASSPITLAATGGGSDNTVTFSVDNSSTCTGATVSGTSLSFSSVTPTCTIVVDANQLGNTDYAAAAQIQATILVTSALLPTGAPVIMSESTFLGEIHNGSSGGGATSSSNPDGGSMAIDPNGNAIIGATYGGGILSFNAANATNPSILVSSYSNQTGAVAVDPHGNLFVGDTYGGAPYVIKIPYNSSTKAYAAYTAAPTANCTGATSDSAPCLMNNVTAGSTYPIQALTFDSAGDLFYTIQTDNATAGTTGISFEGSVWECTAACLYSGSPAPVMLTQEPTVNDTVTPTTDSATTTLSPTTKVSQVLGGLAVDSAGNLFFTDTAEDSQSLIHYSDLYELPYSSTNGYSTTPTILVTEIVNPPAQYPSEIDAVTIATSSTGTTVAFTDQAGVYAFTDSLTTPLVPANVQATMFTVSPQGGKYLAYVPVSGTPGALYAGDYSGAASADSVYYTTIGTAAVPGTVLDGQTGTLPGTAVIGSSTTPVSQFYTVLNDGNCTTPETVTFTSTQFSAALTTSGTPPAAACNGTFTDGTWFATTLTFAPVAPANGAVSETLTATDSSNNSGTATVTGTAQNLLAQTISFTNPGTASSTATYGAAPITLAATATSGLAVTFTLDASTTSGAATLSGSTLTITGVGTIVVDANQAGNSTYQAATQVQATIVVGAASQTITLTPSATTAVYPTTITLTASGGGSGQPVVLAITAGSAYATLSGDVLTPTGVAGQVTVQATQAASTNGDYLAATPVSVMVTFTNLGTAATPTFSPASGTALYNNVNNTVKITDATSGVTIYFTTDGSTPTTSSSSCTSNCQVTLTDSLSGTQTQSYTVNAIALGAGYTGSSVGTATYTVANLQPAFTATATPTAVNLTPGSTATVEISITPNAAFLGTVTFSCSGAPAGVTCGFSPSSLSPPYTGTNVSTVLTITDAASSSSAKRRGPNPFIPGGATFALALCFLGFRKRRGLLLSLVLLAGLFGLTQLTGCGNNAGNSSTGGTTTTMTVTATSTYAGSTLTQTLPITITVRP